VTDDFVGRKLVLTGPESLTQEELVATIGRVLGRPARSFADWVADHAEYFR